jgi:hypothetical protein
MTDAQDMILDKLVGSKVGVNWPDGPLALAAQVLDETERLRFGRTKPMRSVKAEIAKRLGYPMLLCETMQGAVFGLKEEEDRRSFAMLVFRAVSVPGRPSKLTDGQQNRLVMEVVLTVHTQLCSPSCPQVAAYRQAITQPGVSARQFLRNSTSECSLPTQLDGHDNRLRSDLGGLLRQALIALDWGERSRGWASAGASARLVANERGVAAAAKLCVDIARRCGLAAEALE